LAAGPASNRILRPIGPARARNPVPRGAQWRAPMVRSGPRDATRALGGTCWGAWVTGLAVGRGHNTTQRTYATAPVAPRTQLPFLTFARRGRSFRGCSRERVRGANRLRLLRRPRIRSRAFGGRSAPTDRIRANPRTGLLSALSQRTARPRFLQRFPRSVQASRQKRWCLGDAWFWLGPEAAEHAIEELARHDLVAEYAGSRPDLTVIHVKGEADVGDRAARLLQQAGIEPRRPENGDIPILLSASVARPDDPPTRWLRLAPDAVRNTGERRGYQAGTFGILDGIAPQPVLPLVGGPCPLKIQATSDKDA
jgi:hypothetical protein